MRSLRILSSLPIETCAVLTLAALVAALGGVVFSAHAHAQSPHSTLPDFAPCTPDSDASDDVRDGTGKALPGAVTLSSDFCAEWNPEYPFNGHHCCSTVLRSKGSRRRRRLPAKYCSRDRFKPNFCEDITDEEREYTEAVSSGKIQDVLPILSQEFGRRGDQAYCTVNNGFLAHGRPILPTPYNRVKLRMAERCTNYGTDGMVGMIEWAGHEIAKEFSDPRYSGLHLLIGDITAPRGGCLAGRNGPAGHASHTNGQDADIGFLTPLPGRQSPTAFHTGFDAKANWWLIKQWFKNPFACVRVIFLDKKLIRKLGKVARGDEDWNKYWRYIRHIPGHKNHMHVRIGDVPGAAGCSGNPEDETEDMEGVEESVDLEALDLQLTGPKPASTSSRLDAPAK